MQQTQCCTASVHNNPLNMTRCLRDNVAGSSAERNSQCATSYAAFDACRKGMLAQQREATNDALVAQQVGDHRAKALFERYCIMQDTN